LWAALIVLALPGVYLWAQWIGTDGWDDSARAFAHSAIAELYVWQVAVFFGLLLLFHTNAIRRMILPKTVMKQRAQRLAKDQFISQGLHRTEHRCGVLIFIAMLEHHVEIMVDTGLSEHVDNTRWQQTISSMSPLMRQGKTAEACQLAIDAVSEPMKQFAARPASQQNAPLNELPDHVIEL
jgi:putative membrane protein